jgi:FkbM family methyltransferase
VQHARLTQLRAQARETAKRHVKAQHRDRLRWLRRELRLELNAVRSGVSPMSVVRHRLLRQNHGLRFRGISVCSIEPETTWDVARDLWSHREYDIPGFAPEAGWRIIDIGANVGLYAMHAASRGASVVAYEPHPEAARCCRANTTRWDVEVREAAVVGRGSQRVRLYINPGRDIRNTLMGKDVLSGDLLSAGIDVDTVPLADVLQRPCDLLKIDCEGGEFDIFSNGGEALRNARRIIAEIHLNMGSLDDAVADVERAGFAVAVHESEHLGAPYVQLAATRND